MRDTIAAARPIFQLHGVEGNLQVIYPDSEHDFPIRARAQAYAFLDQHLREKQ